MDRFDLYFASLMATTMHPGYTRDDTPKPDEYQCAQMALNMIQVRKLLEEQIQCLSG